MKKAERLARQTEHMEVMEKIRQSVQFGERIVPDQTVEFFSMYEFDSAQDVFAFLGVAEEFGCDVHFKNENILCKASGDKGHQSLAIIAYMAVKTVPEIGRAYISYLEHERGQYNE